MAAVDVAPSVATGMSQVRTQAIRLFAVGFLVLFMELACIRWFATYVVFLQFFTNVILIASFLGMSCGCLAAQRKQEWLHYFPVIGLGAIVTALAMSAVYHFWSGLLIDVGSQRSAQEVFFGTEYGNPDVAKFVVPIEAIAAIFFVLVALMFVGLGQVMGRAFDAYPNRVLGYTLNIGGSLAGIVAFSALAFLKAPPVVWFLICCAGIAYLLYQERALNGVKIAALVTVVVLVSMPGDWLRNDGHVRRWSPYYMVDHDTATGFINVNGIGHQQMVPFATGASIYSLIHLLQQHSGGKSFEDMLVIGAGSGNDIAHALKFGTQHIDAVEIDPVIQDIGRRYHPDHPYSDPRIVPHLDDGRHFLRTTDQKYDLVVYALVDSLVLHSGYANIRLESYLFTREALEDVKRALKPGGTFVTYNYFRQGWVVERVAAMAERVFGCKPTVISLPYRAALPSSSPTGFTMIVAGCNRRIADAFASHPNFWLSKVAVQNRGVNGFGVQPRAMPASKQAEPFPNVNGFA